ncbi:seizure 6-like protein [Tachypleus tridentatus]|uniref:seizure 6-like protein n=1 Tax=Tachypleus tridentatus TaxID=6853 RepID=UPI003FD1AD5D
MNLFKMFPISSLFWCFAFIPYYSESCGEVSFNVTSGIVRLQDLHHDVTEDFNCLWFYTAPPGRELLVKVDHVHLNSPRRRWTSLKLNVDDQTLDLPSKCVRCLSEIVAGQELRIVFTYKTRTSKRGRTGSLHLGSFQIRFKAFDPFLCEPPVAPKNGYIITEQRRVGNTIEYRCNPPFELGGNPHSRCRIPKSSPIPEWSEPSPKCTIPDCTDGVIHKVAGRGVISNPGYESKRLLPQRQCRWEIMAGRGERIKVFFPYIQLKGEETTELNIYDGGLFRPLTNLTLLTKKTKSELVTSTNKLIVFFRTGDVPNSSELQGFFMEYWNISGLCFHPGQIENGEVVGQNFIIGSTVRFLCHPNFHLIGAQSATCLPGGRWNVSKPRCHFLNLTLSSSETFGLFEFLVNSRPVQAPDESSQSSSNMFSTTLSSSSEDENQFVFSVTPAFTSFSRNYLSNAVETTSVISFSHSFSHTSTEDSKNHLQRNSTKDSKNHLQRNSTKDSKNHLQRNSTKTVKSPSEKLNKDSKITFRETQQRQ